MRRIWAYIVIAFTALVLVGSTFTMVMTKTHSNMEYQSGREIVFKVTEKEDGKELDDEKLQDVADTMAVRLDKADVSRYNIELVGHDSIRVTFSQEYSDNYNDIISYLTFNGTFALTNSLDTEALPEDFLTDEDAFLDSINGYPCIVLPVNTSNENYKKVLETAKDEGATPETTESDDEEGESTSTYYLYLWYNYDENCTFENYNDSSRPEYEIYHNRVVMKFKVEDDEDSQYFDSDHTQLFSAIDISSLGKTTAFNKARFYVNLLNAEVLDFDVTYMYSNSVDAAIESAISFGNSSYVSLNKTFFATVCAVLIISALLVVFFKLGTVSIVTVTLVSLLAGLASTLMLSAEFSVMAIIGLISLALTSLASGIIYCSKLKDEAYKGRSLKKANIEASKKSLLPIVDIHVVLVVIGVFAYIFGGILMRTFAAITVVGGLASLILNIFGLRGMMWLATNATSVQGKYHLFGIEDSKVPNIIKEEKQTFFGGYEHKDFTKQSKKIGIIGSLLLVGFAVTMGVFAGLNNGNIYVSTNQQTNSNIYFETTAVSTSINEESIFNFLDKMYVYKDGQTVKEAVNLKSVSDSAISSYDYSLETVNESNEKESTDYKLFVVTIDSLADENYHTIYGTKDSPIFEGTFEEVVEEYFASEYAEFEEDATITIKAIKTTIQGEPKVGHIALGALVALAVATLYLALRYRLSRGISYFLTCFTVGVIIMGLFSAIRVAVSTYVIAAVPVSVLFTSIAFIIFANKERELILDDRSKDASPDNRKEIMKKAISYAFPAITVFTVIAAYIMVNFYGFGPSSTSIIYVVGVLGVALGFLFVSTVAGPLAALLYAKFHKDGTHKEHKHHKKSNKAKPNKSAEPEEAVFIGIND